MLYRRCSVVPAFACTLLLACLVSRAHGYIDWGSGSYMLQLLLAGILGGLFAVKLYWMKIKAFFLSKFGKPKDEQK